MLEWTGDSWTIVLVGFLAASACSMLGVFLVLRRMSMVADAISHAVLPGIVIAFLVSGSRDPLPMLIGAGAVGLLTTVFIEWLHRSGRIQSDASIGIVFTAMFAIGVVLISAKAGMVDLDQECVLYGEIAYAPWDDLIINGVSWGVKPLWVLGFAVVVNVVFITLFYKELKLTTFDPMLATTLGFSAAVMHYALMGLVSLTTVAAFESVGAILVVAMFVVPAATAYLLSDKLSRLLILVVILSGIISMGGYAMARALDASIAGSMSTVAGLLFALAFLFSPRHGLVSRQIGAFGLKLRIAGEDWVAHHYRIRESNEPARIDPTNSPLASSNYLWLWIRLKGLAEKVQGEWSLTPAGLELAQDIVRRHRSWEGYLHDDLNVPADHVHRSAHDVEHFLDPHHPDSEAVLTNDRSDPHGSEIPGA